MTPAAATAGSPLTPATPGRRVALTRLCRVAVRRSLPVLRWLCRVAVRLNPVPSWPQPVAVGLDLASAMMVGTAGASG